MKKKMKKGKVAIDKLIFFFLIFIISLLLFFQTPTITGKGQIVFPLISVQYPYDIKILNINVKEGEKIEKGEILFSFLCERIPSLRLDYQKKVDKRDIERLLLEKILEKNFIEKSGREEIGIFEKQLIMKISEKNYYSQLIIKKQQEFEKMKNLKILNVYTLPEIERQERFLENLKIECLKIEEEIVSLKSSIEKIKRETQVQLNNLDTEIKKIKSQIKEFEEKENNKLVKNFPSPLTGKVDRIFVYNSEFCPAGQILMNIVKIDRLKVIAFFPLENRKMLNPGRKVVVKLPDGKKLKGEITNIYSTTEQLPPEFLNIRQSPLKHIVVSIEIKDRFEKSDEFYGMRVKVFIK